METVIEKLRVKGAPVPRNSPTSPLMATSRANRPIPSTILSLDKSYDFILKQANKNSSECAYLNPKTVGRRMEFLNRVKEANFGISTMDSPYVVSEDHVVKETPCFVLCGQNVSGVDNKTIEKFLTDHRTGNFKTSAKEMQRVRTAKAVGKCRSEPSARPREYKTTKDGTRSEYQDNMSIRSDFNTATIPSSAISIVSQKPITESGASDKSPFELTGRGFKGGHVSVEKFVPRSSEYMSSRAMRHSGHRITRQEHTEKNVKTNGDDIGSLRTCLSVNSKNGSVIRPRTIEEYAKSSQNQGGFSKSCVRIFNNPYRHLKHRENVLMRDRKVGMKTVRKITQVDTSTLQIHNNKHFGIPRGILRVPNPCSDTFLLQMLLAVNSPKSYHQKSVTGKYSDIAIQRDLDEYMVVGSSARSKTHSEVQRSQVVTKSGKSNPSNLENVEEGSTWAGNDVNEDEIRQP